MKNFINSFIWAFLLLFSLPTVLIVASWKSIPGDGLFPVKLGLEQSLAFIVSPSYAASGQLQIKYTERRFADAQRSITERHSVAGLTYLAEQVATTKTTISRVGDAKTKTELTDSYIQTLEDVSAALEQQKRTVVSLPPPQTGEVATQQTQPQSSPVQVTQTVVIIPTPITTPAPMTINKPANTVQQPITPMPTPTSTPTSTPIPTPTPIYKPEAKGQVVTTTSVSVQNAIVAIQIDATQQTIKDTIKELIVEKAKSEKQEKDRINNQNENSKAGVIKIEENKPQQNENTTDSKRKHFDSR